MEVASVTDIHGMFPSAALRNGDLPQWDVSSAREMYSTFARVTVMHSRFWATAVLYSDL